MAADQRNKSGTDRKCEKRKVYAFATFTGLILVWGCVQSVSGHARLVEPPSRNTLWRFGYHAAPNFEDSELFCGGIKVWKGRNKKKVPPMIITIREK